MKRAMASALTLFCVACGGGSDDAAPQPAPTEAAAANTAAPGGENEPPVIVEASIEPANPGASDPLSLELVVRDPDQDRVRTTVEWYKNGELLEEESGLSIDAGVFSRGDRVYAIAYATDGKHDVSAQTPIISIANALPRVTSLRIKPDRATALDLLEAEVQTDDADGDRVQVSYRWLRNGQPVTGADTSRLAPGIAHRGDTVAVQVNIRDSSDETGWIQSKDFALANAAPSITTQPNYELSGSGQYSYAIAAKDPDGDDPLRYEVVQGPPGMTVDVASGVVTWRVPADAKGVYPIELAVSDPHGGKTTQSYSLAVDWDEPGQNAARPSAGQPAASPDKAAGSAGASGKKAKAPAVRSADDESDDDYTDVDQEGGADEEEF